MAQHVLFASIAEGPMGLARNVTKDLCFNDYTFGPASACRQIDVTVEFSNMWVSALPIHPTPDLQILRLSPSHHRIRLCRPPNSVSVDEKTKTAARLRSTSPKRRPLALDPCSPVAMWHRGERGYLGFMADDPWLEGRVVGMVGQLARNGHGGEPVPIFPC